MPCTTMPASVFPPGTLALDDLSAGESRRQTFVQAGAGDVLSEFMARHAETDDSDAAANGEEVAAGDDAQSAKTFGARFPKAAPATAAVPERRSTRVRPTTGVTTAPATSRVAAAKPPLAPAGSLTSRQSKLADWKNTQSQVSPTSSSATNGKENRFSATATSPLSTASKRRSTALAPSTSALNRTASAGSLSMKKSRVSAVVPSSSRPSTASVPASPRPAVAAKRKAPSTDLTPVPEASPKAAGAAVRRAWTATAQWRMLLLRVQKAEITSVAARLAEVEQAHREALDELAAARDSLDAASTREDALSTQLAASVNSECMLRLAAEELGVKADALRADLARNQQEYAAELSAVRAEATSAQNTAAAQIHSLEADVATLSTSESSLKAQLSATLAQLAAVTEARHADEAARKKLHSTIQDLKGSIRVFCRVRPAGVTSMEDVAMSDVDRPFFVRSVSMSDHGVGGGPLANFTEDLLVQAPLGATRVDGTTAARASHAFNFDKVFTAESTQAELFRELDDLIVSAMDSQTNVAVFAYGATGSGKTHTMIGGEDSSDPDSRGMIPRAIDRVFEYASAAVDRQWAYTFKASLLEIYNDELRCLLTPKSTAAREPKIQHDKVGRVIVSGLEVVPVSSPREVQALLASGARARSVAATACNARSSRSHTVFQLAIDGVNSRTGERLQSQLNLVDLAGSERLDASKAAANPQLLKETQHINSSLSCLVTCMSSLASRSAHVPYRDARLTHLLQESLGRGATGATPRTLFFVNVSPESINFNETLCTLRFAEKLKSVEMNSTPSSASEQANKRTKRK